MALALLILRELLYWGALFLLAQFVVGLFRWQRRRDNPIYQLFTLLTRPIVAAVRRLTPRLIVDAHIPAVAFLLLVAGCLGVGLWHRSVCLQDLGQRGCERWAAARQANP